MLNKHEHLFRSDFLIIDKYILDRVRRQRKDSRIAWYAAFTSLFGYLTGQKVSLTDGATLRINQQTALQQDYAHHAA